MKYALALLASVALHADSPITGRWAMSSAGPAPRVFWMELQASREITGSFFGATGGRLAEIREASYKGAELRFFVERTYDGPKPRTVRAHVRCRRDGAGIQGSTEIDGKLFRWTGWRSPEITDRDDGSWRPADPIQLLREGLPLLQTRRSGRTDDWLLEDGVLRNTHPKADLLFTKEKFWNFEVRAEYHLPPGGNSGIGLRHHYELQLADDFGAPPDVHGNASLYSRIAPSVNASRPPNEWQSIRIRLVGRELTVVLNGTKVIDRRIIEGLSGLALDPYEDRPGPVSLQGDHGPVAFRNVVVTPLVQRH